jgi:hypothetical protein
VTVGCERGGRREGAGRQGGVRWKKAPEPERRGYNSVGDFFLPHTAAIRDLHPERSSHNGHLGPTCLRVLPSLRNDEFLPSIINRTVKKFR